MTQVETLQGLGATLYMVTGIAGSDPELEAAVRCLNNPPRNGCTKSAPTFNLVAYANQQRKARRSPR